MTTQSSWWLRLRTHQERIAARSLRQLFAQPDRGPAMTVEHDGIVVDYSKNLVTTETIGLLVESAEESELQAAIEAMFVGDGLNSTEGRAVLHTALRTPADRRVLVDGRNVVADVHAVLERMRVFAERVRSGGWRGHTGERIRAVVNIGIGGSDLGPAMAYRALCEHAPPGLTVRFVSNVDGRDLNRTLPISIPPRRCSWCPRRRSPRSRR